MAETLTTCPVPGCETQHKRHLLMCPKHWYRIPKPLRDEVYAAYRSEEGVLGTPYRDARAAAISAASS